jgi:hypothetical protein
MQDLHCKPSSELSDSLVWFRGGLGGSWTETSRAFHRSTSYIELSERQTGIPRIEMQPGVMRAGVHATTRCALAITALLPGINLRNFTFEEENKRDSLRNVVLTASDLLKPYDARQMWCYPVSSRINFG